MFFSYLIDGFSVVINDGLIKKSYDHSVFCKIENKFRAQFQNLVIDGFIKKKKKYG